MISPLRAEITFPLRCLCERLGRDVEQAERLLRLTLALHDVGKLNGPWQTWARAWQTFRLQHGYQNTLPDDGDPLAHTDYDSDNEAERALQKQLNGRMRRGPHAGESAQACLPIVWEATSGDPFWVAVIAGAIMRHHTPSVDMGSVGAFRLAPGTAPSLAHALRLFGFEQDAARWAGSLTAEFERGSGALGNAIKEITPSYSSYDAALMYFVFVRALRLADQRSGSYWKEYRDTNLVEDREK